MTSHLRLGRIVGLLLLVHLASGLILPYVLLRPLMGSPSGFLERAAAMEGTVRISVLLLFIGGAVPVAISTLAWPVVRRCSSTLGLWMIALSVANLTLQIVENSHWLTMLSVSQEYVGGGAAGAVSFTSHGIVVRAAWRWAHYSHILVVVGWLFTFYWVMFRSAIVSRVLAAAGIVAAVLHTIGITLPVFAGYTMPMQTVFGMPLGVVGLVLAIRLMVRGFRESGDVSGSTDEGHGAGGNNGSR